MDKVVIQLSAEGSEAVARVFRELADKSKNFADNLVTGGRNGERSLSSLGGTAKRVFEIFTGFSLANAAGQIASFAQRGISELTRMGLENQRVEESFTRMASAVGLSADTMLASLKRASSGIVDTNSIMLASSKALAQGLNQDQLVRIMEVARASATLAGKTVSESYNAIAESVTNLQVRQLREFGIVIDQAKAYDDYARSLGTVAAALNEVGQRAALLQSIDEQTRRSRLALTQGELTNAQEIEKAKAKWSDFWAGQAKGFSDSYAALVKGGAAIIAWGQTTGEWLDTLATKWENYKAASNLQATRYGPGGTQVTSPLFTRPTSAADMRALRDIGDDMTGLSQSLGTSAAAGIDRVKKALLDADQAMKEFSVAQQTGAATGAQYAAAIQQQIAALKAVSEQTPEIKNKILDLQAALAGVNFTALQQGLTASLQVAQAREAALLSTVKESVAQRNTIVEDGAVVEAAIRAKRLGDDRMLLERALTDVRANETQKFQYRQQLRALDSQFDTAKSAERIALWAREAAAFAEMRADFQAASALANGPEASVQPLLTAMDAWSKLGLKIHEATEAARLDGDEEKRLAASILATAAAVIFFGDTLGDTTNDAQVARDRLGELIDKMNLLKTFRATAEDVAEAWTFVTDSSVASAKALGDYTTEMGKAEQQAALFGKSIGDELSAKIAVTEQAILKAAAAFGVESDAVKLLQERLAGLKGQSFEQSLAGIQREAALVGRDFDLASANLGAFQRRILELQAIKNPTGEILADLDQLKVKFADTQGFIKWRDTFRDVFGSISSAINTSVQGVILGTQTMAEAWDKLWKSIVLSFINSGIQRLLTGLQNQLWDFVAGLFGGSSSGSSGGGWLNAIIGGAAKLFGGGSALSTTAASVNAFDQSIDTLGLGTSALDKGFGLLNTSTGNLSAGIGAALSAIGVGMGIYGLTQGGSAGSMALSAGGTALSVYALAQSVSVLAVNAGLISTALPTIGTLVGNAMMAIAPGLVTAFNTAFGTSIGVTAGTTGVGVGAGAGSLSAGITAGLTTALAWLANPATVFAGMALAGGFASIMTDAENAAQEWRVTRGALLAVASSLALVSARFDNLSTALSPAHLLGTLAELQSALESLPDIANAAWMGATDLTAAEPELRAKFGATLVAALDAAYAQGVDGARFVTDRNRRLADPMVGGVEAAAHERQVKDILPDIDLFRRWAQAGRDLDKIIKVQQHFLDTVDIDAITGRVTAKDGGALPDWVVDGPQNTQLLDAMKMNAQLDREHLTIAIRNAIVDVGAMLGVNAASGLTPTGSELAWKSSVEGGVDVLPSVAAIAQVQATLEAAGFTPGNYGQALEAFLISVDANVVNHPMWATFTDALKNATTADAVAAAIAALMPPLSPVEFYDAAKSVTDSINAEMKAMVQHRADIVAAGTDQANVDKVDAILEAMVATVKAYAGLVQLFATIPVEMAAITGDLADQTKAAIDAWQVTRKSMDDAVALLETAFRDAVNTGNVVAIQQAGQALHDATINRYNAELKMVQSIVAAIESTLGSATSLVQMVTRVAQWDISSGGDTSTITALLGALQSMAETATTTAARLWAVDQALQAIIATLPTAIAKFGSFATAAQWLAGGSMQTAEQLQFGAAGPRAISEAIVGGASPFLGAQQAEIDAATGPARFALLQQQAVSFQALADAAIAGVTQWANQAIAGAQEAAKILIDGLAAQRDAQLAAIDAQIEGINVQSRAVQRVAQLAQESRRAESEAIQEQIAKQRELTASIESMGKFIDALKQGPLGPGNPAGKLMLAQDSFAKALQAYTSAPTAAGLTDLQGLAQSVLSLAEPIFSKPSPQFQALAATTIQQLLAAQAMAEAMVTDSELLQSQLDALIALDKTASQVAADQSQAFADQIDALNAQKQSITDDFETQTKAIEAALVEQVAAINAARAAEITAINTALSTALLANAAQQAPLIAAQLAAQDAMLRAVTSPYGLSDIAAYAATRQDVAIGILGGILLAIQGATGAAGGMDNVTEGLYHLHDREAVLPADLADDWRAGRGRFGIRSAARGAGLRNDWYVPPERTAEQIERGRAMRALEHYLQAQQYANDRAQPNHGINAADMAINDARFADVLGNVRIIQPPPPSPPAPPVPPVPPPPPPPPPYVPAGPAWLHGQGVAGAPAGAMQGTSGGGPVTIVVQLDGKVIGKAVLPTVRDDARTGGVHTIIVETKPK